MADYRNILIIKPSAMGDIVHTLPAMASLRRSFPQAKITWLVGKPFASLLDCVSGLDDRILFDRKQLARWWYSPAAFRELRRLLGELRKRQFDLVLDFQGLLRTAFFAWQTRSSNRFGMTNAREGATLFYTHRVDKPVDSHHVVDYYNAMVAAAGGTKLSTEGMIHAPETAKLEIRQKLDAVSIGDRPYAVLIPGSAHQAKCWPAERFSRLADRISNQLNAAVVVVGSASERPLGDQVVHRASVPVFNLAGQTTIPQLVALLGGAKLVVSNDTGPGHIAEAMRVPTVLIFGHINPLRVGPYRRVDAVAAIDPAGRGDTIRSSNPAYLIHNVTEAMVWDKVTAALTKGGK